MRYHKLENNTDFFFSHYIETKKRKSYKMESHYHNLYEIYLIESGSCNYFIDNKSYKLEVGDIVLIPEGTIHNTEYIDTAHSRMLINCSRKFIPSSITEHLPKIQYLYRNPTIKQEVIEIFKKIEEEFARADKLSEDILKCLTHSFFFLLIRNADTRTIVESKNKYIEKAVNYLQQNLKNDITLTQLAKECSLSPEHLSRMFKKETGFGFCEFLNLIRLQKAESLLKQSDDLSVSEIASECGFNDSNYFSVKFKKVYGFSPKKVQLMRKKDF